MSRRSLVVAATAIVVMALPFGWMSHFQSIMWVAFPGLAVLLSVAVGASLFRLIFSLVTPRTQYRLAVQTLVGIGSGFISLICALFLVIPVVCPGTDSEFSEFYGFFVLFWAILVGIFSMLYGAGYGQNDWQRRHRSA